MPQVNNNLSFKISIASIVIIFVGVANSLGIIPQRRYSDADFGITTYHSANDQDNDGVDDQADILQSARAYLATRPKYGSKYYVTGYPDDKYGVCTDVVVQGMKGAGYDLMMLVDEDIKAHPEAYDVEVADAKIDFRRVKNLQVWFSRHTQSLTTNIHDISEWQGGDIVIFQDHIGIISDQRNQNGIPLLIHHYSPLQITYEEDALDYYHQDIIGHYRVS